MVDEYIWYLTIISILLVCPSICSSFVSSEFTARRLIEWLRYNLYYKDGRQEDFNNKISNTMIISWISILNIHQPREVQDFRRIARGSIVYTKSVPRVVHNGTEENEEKIVSIYNECNYVVFIEVSFSSRIRNAYSLHIDVSMDFISFLSINITHGTWYKST